MAKTGSNNSPVSWVLNTISYRPRPSAFSEVRDVGLRAGLLASGVLHARDEASPLADDRVQLCEGVAFASIFRISATVLASRPAAVNSLSVAAAMFVRLPYCLSRRVRLISPMPIT